MKSAARADFDLWYEALRAEAQRRDASWLVGGERQSYRQAFEAGHSPAQEIEELLRIAEWRGCGCGGG